MSKVLNLDTCELVEERPTNSVYLLGSVIVLLLQLATLTGHTFRVLYRAISPDGQVYLSFIACDSCLLIRL